MRFYTKIHTHYCGVDLHAKTMYLCILDRDGKTILDKNMRSRPEDFLAAIETFRDDLVVAVDCIFTWHWLADLCRNDIRSFERVQDFSSYSRLVKCEHSSAGKKLGTGGSEIGNAHLKWAFSEPRLSFFATTPKARSI